MSSTQSIYLLNVIICVNLAVIATYTWLRADRERSLGTFAVAAWLFALTDVAFFYREDMPFWTGRYYPTLLVTVSMVATLMGARRLAGRPDAFTRYTAIIPVHAVVLAIFLAISSDVSAPRAVANTLLWSALSFAAAHAIYRADSADVRSAMRIPALVFTLHGTFHLLRAIVAAIFIGTAQGVPGWLYLIGDVEPSAFMTSLYLGLMVGYNQMNALQLLRTERELRELKTFLPICAWCRDVRYEGVWQRLEDFFAARGDVRISHGMCDTCQERMMKEL